MRKLVIAAAVLALSTGVNAQEKAGGTGTAGIGGLSVATLTAMGIGAAVAAAIISNNRGTTINPGQEFELVCNGVDTLSNGVCTNTTNTVTVTGTGTNTSTTTVPVITTYPAIVQPVN
ncbi:hypothetical protein RNAN_3702 [Rheinheimera nanhaiensis E407-8]|uniref:Uncharacterized protein n=2 Tax=Rheinheimera TaxID=67575 RepID=I1E2Z8_9GAMM|nr:hypothetical protein RNAN_3702 [Rheinheimera nanhaiensis E407-8]